jgi:20S proteasome alpha/beta subunit
MSIAIGFMCSDGIVLAADSELSNAFTKVPGDKAWIYKYPAGADNYALQVGIVGAGDAAFIQYASERIHVALEEHYSNGANNPVTMSEVNKIIQAEINDLHHSHLYPASHLPDAPSVELIIGIRLADRRIRLAKTYLTSITKVWNYEAVGVGSALANFIIKRFYAGRVTVSQATFIASQVLMHVKANVPRCGGASKVIVMLQKKGAVGWAQQQTVLDHEAFLTKFDDAIAPVFFGGADQNVSNQEFHKRVDALSEGLKALRKVEDIESLGDQVRKDIVLPVGTITISGPGVFYMGRHPGLARNPTIMQTASEMSGPADQPAPQSPTDDQTSQPASPESRVESDES